MLCTTTRTTVTAYLVEVFKHKFFVDSITSIYFCPSDLLQFWQFCVPFLSSQLHAYHCACLCMTITGMITSTLQHSSLNSPLCSRLILQIVVHIITAGYIANKLSVTVDEIMWLCLFTCQQANLNSCGWILMIFAESPTYGTLSNHLGCEWASHTWLMGSLILPLPPSMLMLFDAYSSNMAG